MPLRIRRLHLGGRAIKVSPQRLAPFLSVVSRTRAKQTAHTLSEMECRFVVAHRKKSGSLFSALLRKSRKPLLCRIIGGRRKKRCTFFPTLHVYTPIFPLSSQRKQTGLQTGYTIFCKQVPHFCKQVFHPCFHVPSHRKTHEKPPDTSMQPGFLPMLSSLVFTPFFMRKAQMKKG